MLWFKKKKRSHSIREQIVKNWNEAPFVQSSDINFAVIATSEAFSLLKEFYFCNPKINKMEEKYKRCFLLTLIFILGNCFRDQLHISEKGFDSKIANALLNYSIERNDLFGIKKNGETELTSSESFLSKWREFYSKDEILKANNGIAKLENSEGEFLCCCIGDIILHTPRSHPGRLLKIKKFVNKVAEIIE